MSIKVNISNVITTALAKLSMLNNNQPSMGLKFVSNVDNETENYVKLHLLNAKKYNVIAVYFRYFEEKRPISQIYIYEENSLKDNTLNNLYKKLCNSCKVPMFFIFSKIEIKIFNSMSKKDIYEQNIEPME